jgi:hypothetical protein
MCINIVVQKLFISELSYLLMSILKIRKGIYCLSSLPNWYILIELPACNRSSPGSNPDISQKYKIGVISKGVANTL